MNPVNSTTGHPPCRFTNTSAPPATGTHEKIQKFSDPEITVCPYCGGELKRVISAPAFAMKGGGWYADGYSSAKPSASGGGSESSGSSDSAAAPAAAAPAAAAPAATPSPAPAASRGQEVTSSGLTLRGLLRAFPAGLLRSLCCGLVWIRRHLAACAPSLGKSDCNCLLRVRNLLARAAAQCAVLHRVHLALHRFFDAAGPYFFAAAFFVAMSCLHSFGPRRPPHELHRVTGFTCQMSRSRLASESATTL